MSDKRFTFTNEEMDNKILDLEKFLDRDDIVGYISARNTRRLRDASYEYSMIKTDLLNQYGTEIKDSNGDPTGRIELRSDDPNYAKVAEEISKTANIQHEVVIFTIPYDEVKNKLTGREILEIDWMLDE